MESPSEMGSIASSSSAVVNGLVEITVCPGVALTKDIFGRLGSEKDERNCCVSDLDVAL